MELTFRELGFLQQALVLKMMEQSHRYHLTRRKEFQQVMEELKILMEKLRREQRRREGWSGTE
jgi:hypothetical protein